MIKAAIIGCGTIGTEVSRFLARDNRFRIVAVCDADESKATALLKKLGLRAPVLPLNEAVRAGELVVEAAGPRAVDTLLRCPGLDTAGRRLLIMSTGGLVKALDRIARFRHCRIIVPSGAVAGLDAVRAVAGRIRTLSLTTTKPPEALAGAPYLATRRWRPDRLRKPRTVFEGTLHQAIAGFPQNINVAASLFLASRFRRLRVRIVADPGARFNKHEIRCTGPFGEIVTRTVCQPARNPKTSYLSVLSALAAVRNLTSTLHGT